MFVYADGTVTGSVDVAKLEAIQKAVKAASKKQLAAIAWPVTSVIQVTDVIEPEPEPEPPKAKVIKKEDS